MTDILSDFNAACDEAVASPTTVLPTGTLVKLIFKSTCPLASSVIEMNKSMIHTDDTDANSPIMYAMIQHCAPEFNTIMFSPWDQSKPANAQTAVVLTVKTDQIDQLEVIKPPSGSIPLISIPQQRLDKKIATARSQRLQLKALINPNVDPLYQKLILHLSRTLKCSWVDDIIVIDNALALVQPYKATDCLRDWNVSTQTAGTAAPANKVAAQHIEKAIKTFYDANK